MLSVCECVPEEMFGPFKDHQQERVFPRAANPAGGLYRLQDVLCDVPRCGYHGIKGLIL